MCTVLILVCMELRVWPHAPVDFIPWDISPVPIVAVHNIASLGVIYEQEYLIIVSCDLFVFPSGCLATVTCLQPKKRFGPPLICCLSTRREA